MQEIPSVSVLDQSSAPPCTSQPHHDHLLQQTDLPPATPELRHRSLSGMAVQSHPQRMIVWRWEADRGPHHDRRFGFFKWPPWRCLLPLQSSLHDDCAVVQKERSALATEKDHYTQIRKHKWWKGVFFLSFFLFVLFWPMRTYNTPWSLD